MKRIARWLFPVVVAQMAACSFIQQPEPSQPVISEKERDEKDEKGEFSIPVLSVSATESRSVEEAYRVQRTKVVERLKGRAPAGFKAGLPSRAAQQKFGVEEAVAGVLWPTSVLHAGAVPVTVSLSDFRKPMLEVELAFRASSVIDRPVADIRELRQHIDRIYAALELPDLGFEQPGPLTGSDIVAANVAANRFVLGTGYPVFSVDVNAIFAELEKDGELVQKADATAVMRNQWRALLWLVNRSIESGWTIEPGQILLTGAMGSMLPLEEGHYVADYGELGKIELVVEP